MAFGDVGTAEDVSSAQPNQSNPAHTPPEIEATLHSRRNSFGRQTPPLDSSQPPTPHTSSKLQVSPEISKQSLNMDMTSATSYTQMRNASQSKLKVDVSAENLGSIEGLQKNELGVPKNRKRGTSAACEVGTAAPDNVNELDAGGLSRITPPLYTVSYLILFAMLGTLARLGLQALHRFPNIPVAFTSIWANFIGSLIMGFLVENRMLFNDELEALIAHEQVTKKRSPENHGVAGGSGTVEINAFKKAHNLSKKTIPLYTGLTTGFCGSLTSFSAFLRDVFLALANKLRSSHGAAHGTLHAVPMSRNFGYSIMASLDVVFVTVGLCIAMFYFGTHLAHALKPYTPRFPFRFIRRYPDRYVIFLAFGAWLCTILTMILFLERNAKGIGRWPSEVLFSLVFAPVGCLARFYTSLYLNDFMIVFPWGTLAVNTVGTIILGLSYDLQRIPLGGVISCQVLQGVQDGFCGCLTTVSTWVAEMTAMKRKLAYLYGTVSVVVSLCFLIVIMGSMSWTRGWNDVRCTA
ncbi:Fluoride export protein 1 [Podosphaera aphanis]|nr:Fluoride export protein 1 [Podosphaera aphanis]